VVLGRWAIDVSIIPEGKPLHIHLIASGGNRRRELVVGPVHVDLSVKLVHGVRIVRGVMTVYCELIIADVEGPVANIGIDCSYLITAGPLYLNVVNLHKSGKHCPVCKGDGTWGIDRPLRIRPV
jgi:hypothetical protein